jgi:hypothetical protein
MLTTVFVTFGCGGSILRPARSQRPDGARAQSAGLNSSLGKPNEFTIGSTLRYGGIKEVLPFPAATVLPGVI